MKIVMLGAAGVGKTTLCQKYVNGVYDKDYIPTSYQQFYKPNISVKNRKYSMEIIDTAGESDFQIMYDQWIEQANAFAVVFQLDDDSVDRIQSII